MTNRRKNKKKNNVKGVYPDGVYFIYAPNQKRVKFGHSNKPNLRYMNLKTGFMDYGILLCGIVTDEGLEVETRLQEKFKHLHSHGEWYNVTRELADYLFGFKSEFAKVVIYYDLEILEETIIYTDLEVSNSVEETRRIFFKILLPSLFLFIGLGIAYYFTLYEQDRQIASSHSYWYIASLFISIPLVAVFLQRNIIQFITIRKVRAYFALVLVNVMLMAVAGRFWGTLWFGLIQTTALLAYVHYAALLLVELWVLKNDRANWKKALAKDIPDLSELISRRTKLRRGKENRNSILSVPFGPVIMLSLTNHAFTEILSVIGPAFVLASGFLGWCSIKNRRANIELKELEKQINVAACDELAELQRIMMSKENIDPAEIQRRMDLLTLAP